MQALLCYLLKIAVTYPFVNFPLRITVHYLLYGETPPTRTQHVTQTVTPFVLAAAIACFVHDVAVVFGFVGALTRTTVFFFFPALLMLRSVRTGPLTPCERVSCWALLACWAATTVFGLIGCIRNLL